MKYNFYLLCVLHLLFITQLSLAQNDSLVHPYDVIHYQLNLDLYKNYSDPFPLDFAAIEQITLQADSAIDSLHLDAAGISLTIDSVLTDGKSFSQVGNDLQVALR